MPQTITPPIAGMQIAVNTVGGGQVKLLAGFGDPNLSATDSSAGDLANASTGSIYLRMDGSTSTSYYVKTALPNTWTGK